MLSNLDLLQNFWAKSLICLSFSFLLTFFSIRKFLCFIKDKEICRQPIRQSGPQTHIKEKKNTPTMGGIFIILSTLICTLLFIDLSNSYILVSLFVMVSFSLIGFTDDFIKVMHKNTNGFRGSIKLIIQFAIIGIAFLWLCLINDIHLKNYIFIPIIDSYGYRITLTTVLYIIFVNIVMVGTSNAVNLTDGLDGLVSVPSIVCLICFVIISFIASDAVLAREFRVIHVKNSQELLFLCLSLIGAIVAFLTFNLKPARIFMGDVGSLAIGAFLGILAIIVKQEFIFLLISLLFVAEALSVILQVGSYKIRKKRIFLMAPIHHHFEKKGWSEQEVVRRFWLISIMLGAFGMFVFLT